LAWHPHAQRSAMGCGKLLAVHPVGKHTALVLCVPTRR
jgi:hypothetical protein